MTANIAIRPASAADFAALNQVIEAAVMTWDLPERVKRLSLPSYRYDDTDLAHLSVHIASTDDTNSPAKTCVGIVAWEDCDPLDRPPHTRHVRLLHGLYVHPAHHQQGIGTQLLQHAEQSTCMSGDTDTPPYDGILVKAQHGAQRFFLHHGYRALGIHDQQRDYAHRYWRPCQSTANTLPDKHT